MDFSHYSDRVVAMAVDLVNTRSPVDGHDHLATVAGLVEFLDRYRDEWHSQDWHPSEAGEADLAEVVDLRERLRAVFHAPDDESAAGLLNEILAAVAATPRISTHGNGPHLHFEPQQGRLAQWLGAATAMGLSVVLCDYGRNRFGVCTAHDCNDVYVDTSKNRSRRHCSTTCTTRENVAAHRRREREGSS